MGKIFIEHSEYARDLVDELDAALSTLPPKDRPTWTLAQELAKDALSSRVKEAEFSQPLCAAVQIIFVNLLTTAGLTFKAVVGHSSGEIGCAYASGCLTATQAIRTAYYRGLLSHRAGVPSGVAGGMIAIGTDLDDARSLCELEAFAGRITVAACNAPDSITLSGDLDAIDEVKEVLDDEAKFARVLKVDKAYHSHHMLPCARPYVQALLACNARGTRPTQAPETLWLSSVHAGKQMQPADATPAYWKDNLVSPVMFSQAVKAALDGCGPFDMILEVGPHPALKGPCLSTVQATLGSELPYVGCLERGRDDVDSFSSCLGYVWERFGPPAVDFQAFESLMAPSSQPKQIVQDLPTYPWDHQKTYWNESRLLTSFLRRDEPAHPLLGTLSANSTMGTMQWHNLLRPREISWLDGHQLQGQTVFPGAGYAVMAMEAAKIYAGDRPIQLVEILDLRIGKAITFDSENDLVEINLTLDIPPNATGAEDSIELAFSCDSCLAKETHLSWSAGGHVIISYGEDSASALPPSPEEPPMLTNVDMDKFYDELGALGYGYTKDFRGLAHMKRSTGCSSGRLRVAKPNEGENALMIHPATLDLAFQAFIGAFCSPGDDRLWTLHVPISIGRIAVNPSLSLQTQKSDDEILYQSNISQENAHSVAGDVDLFLNNNTVAQVEHIRFRPFSVATKADDRQLFSRWAWGKVSPDAILEDKELDPALPEEEASARAAERMTYFYIKKLMKGLTDEERDLALPHHKSFLKWCDHVLDVVASGQHHWYEPQWEQDNDEAIDQICRRYSHCADVLMIQRVGQSVLEVIQEDISLVDIMAEDGLLNRFHEEAIGLRPSYTHLGRLVGQIAHRYPNLEVLEIGAGSGGATKHVLDNLASVFNGYTFTDITSNFFDQALAIYGKFEDRFAFKTLDITKDITSQGFSEHSYDMIVAPKVLHATPDLQGTMKNCHRLLKPGGFVLFLEITNPEQHRLGFTFGALPSWWEGVDNGRPLYPFVSMPDWEEVLQATGFSSIESHTTETDRDTLPYSVFSARAIDSQIARIDNALELAIDQPAPEPIVIIGGASVESARLLTGLKEHLPGRRISVYTGVEDLLHVSIAEKTTFIVLSELDNEFFAHLNEDNFEGLQSMLTSAKNILWLTEDAFEGHPYQSMILGLFRTLRLEYVEIQQQILDVDVVTNLEAKTLARTLLQLEASYGFKLGENLWTMEPELRLLNGQIIIPRLQCDDRRNDRYNSVRRPIENIVDTTKEVVGLHCHGVERYLQVENTVAASEEQKKDNVRIQVNYSLPHALRIDSMGYFYVVIGKLINTEQIVVALTDSNASVVEVPHLWTMPCQASPTSKNQILAIGCELIASSIIASASRGSSIVVHEPSPSLITPLLKRASECGVSIKLTTLKAIENDFSGHLVSLHNRATSRTIRSILPARISACFDMSEDKAAGGLAQRIAEHLPKSCKIYDLAYLLQEGASIFSNDDATAAKLLQGALDTAFVEQSLVHTMSVSEIIKSQDSWLDYLTVVDWTKDVEVTTRVRPVDAVNLFADNKTYILIGLAGDLGRSLCRWMIKHGARYIVLSSRTPRIDPKWQQKMMEDDGATVVVRAMNVANKQSFFSVMDDIKATLPPIAGVAHGPLVLQDALFENMDLETMEMVLEAKVKGALFLDQYFSENTLDWMIYFSSQVATGGNRGQSNYSSANMFMNGMAYQRQKRGLAGSTMNIGAIYGVGFVAKAAREENYSLNKLMFVPLSEQDLHQQFAEAVISGRAGSGPSLEVTTGMAWNDPANRDFIPAMDDPRLTWYRLPDQSRKSNAGGKSSGGSVKERLGEATSLDQAASVLKEAMMEKLRTTLQLPPEEFVDADTPLIDQGVDSLVAVSLRTWFSKQLELDLPVLKVLGGASVSDLTDDALQRLPASTLSSLNPSDNEEPATQKDEAVPASTTEENATVSSELSDKLSDQQESPMETPMEIETPMFDKLDPLNESTPATSVSGDNEQEIKDLPPNAESKEIVRKERMSFGQGRFWTMGQLVQDPKTFNVTIGLWIDGPLVIENLSRACDTFVQRHETFRTRFWEENGEPMQGVMPHSRTRMEFTPCKDRDAALEGFEALQHHLYDIENGATCRMVLFSWDPQHYFFVVCYHHIISDGWTFEYMLNELDRIYEGKPLQQIHQYADFAARQRREVEEGKMNKELAYWTDEYRTVPPVLPILPLASAFTRPTLPWDFHEASLRLPPIVAARIKDRSRKHKASTIHFYLAAYQVLLSRLTGVNDVCIGLADANRTGEHDLSTLGFFINLLPMRFAYSTDSTFGEAITQARTKVREALANSRLPFDVLLQKLNIPRTSTNSPLFQAFLDYRQGQSESGKIGAGILSGVEMSRGRTAYDISLEVTEDPTKDPLINVKLQKGLYAKEDVEPLLKSYVNILATFSRNPALKVEEPRLFAKTDLDSAVQLGQGPYFATFFSRPLLLLLTYEGALTQQHWQGTLIDRIDEAVASQPSECALESDNTSVTYAEMATRIDAIASTLSSNGVSKGARVCVMQTPSTDLVSTMLAIMKLGAIYVPLDSMWPTARLTMVLDNCKPSAVVTDKTIPLSHFENMPQVKRVDVEDIATATEQVATIATLEDDCAILYTSGTTGTPKGLTLTHKNLNNSIEGTCSKLGFKPQRVLQQSAPTFDLSLDQIFVALASGGSAYVVPQEKRRDPPEIAKLVATQSITYTMGTPSEYAAWILSGSEFLRAASRWNYLCAGGEPVPRSILRNVKLLDLNQLRFFCIYGPAETTIASHRIEINYRDEIPERVPCGFPMSNYSAYIVGDDLKPVPIGWPGEILIGGPSVCRGYFNDPDLTAAQFLPDTFATSEQQKKGFTTLFRSGDRGRFRQDGALIIDGRLSGSTQIKLRGFRIELKDIESTILAGGDGALTTAIVSVRGEADAQFLVAHAVFSPEHPSSGRAAYLRQILANVSVPNYMRPSMIFELDHMPLNHNSKIDRQAVAELELPEVTSHDQTASEKLTHREAELWNLWCEVLPTEATSAVIPIPDTDFIGVGGNSILLVQVHARMKERMGINVPLFELFEVTTLRTMSAKCDAAIEGTPIDFEAESTLDLESIKSYISSQGSVSARQIGSGIRVLMTGATGFIGRRILESLVAEPAVSEVHCIAVRQNPTYSWKPGYVATWANEGKDSPLNDTDPDLYFNSPKVKQYHGDLTRPLFGLSQDQFDNLSASVDLVVHSGANRAFWDSYHLVKTANVSTTRALIQLAAPRAVPITFISSGGVASINSLSDLTNGNTTGYVASKFISEKLLEAAQRDLGINVGIVRSLFAEDAGDYATKTHSPSDLIRSMLHLDKKIGRRGMFEDFKGRISITHRLDMCDRIAEFAASLAGVSNFHRATNKPAPVPITASEDSKGVNYLSYNNSVTLTHQIWDDFMATNPEEADEEWEALPTMPMLNWFGQSKIQDFEYVIAGQEYEIGGNLQRR